MKIGANTLAQRIAGGYALMIILLAVAVIATIRQVATIKTTSERLDAVRVPVVEASAEMLSGVSHCSSSLRGWVLLQDTTFRSEWHAAWANEVQAPLAALDAVLRKTAYPTMDKALAELHRSLEDLYEEWTISDHAAREEADRIIARRPAAPVHEAIRTISDRQRMLMKADLDTMNGQVVLLNELEWVLLLLGLASGVLLASLITRSISLPVTRAVAVANNIARGDLDTAVAVGGSRELITLGQALASMRDALKARAEESRHYTWLNDGQRAIDEVMRGEKGVKRLADDVVRALAEYSSARVGAFYLVDEAGTSLRLTGRYAIGENAPAAFRLGEALVGQAAVDRTVRMLTVDRPEQIRISSSLMDADVLHVLIAPLQFEDTVVGVIELGGLDRFSEAHLEFVRAATRSIGIAMNVAGGRQRIQELLEETQRQGEELQVQQEELQQTNEELEEQTQRLKVQQEELQVTNEELEEQTQTVQQKNGALEIAQREVEQKAAQLEITSRYKSEFLANMSHELRTPLNSLLILSNDLARNKPGNLSTDQIESAQVIARSGYDLLNLINDILDLSKVEAGRLDLEPTLIQVTSLAADIRSAFGHMARERGLEFHVQADETLPDVSSDRQRLEQVIKNLVSNALKFTERGSVTVSITGHGAEGWAIAVEDTGIGIPAAKQQLIFEAFQQADGGISRRYGGTGLGLSISRELARLLGGRITLRSEEGKGSTFTLLIPGQLPARTAEPPALTGPSDTPAPPPRVAPHVPSIPDQRDEIGPDDRVILIIEDDAAFARVLARQAGERGFKYLAAATGEEGLVLVKRHLPHAVLLDIDLPGMDGHAVLAELKGDPHLRHIPVHIISVNERTLAPIRSGAVEYLVKPVDREQLDRAFSRIEDLVRRKMKNLLIVEDDPRQRLAIAKLIGNGDVRCLEAASAAEAIALLRTHPVDCMVLDIGLPDASGFELLKQLQTSIDGPLPPVIIHTGRELSRSENDELRQYAETIIVKGVRSEERLLDETALFLHRTVKDLPQQKQAVIMELHDPEAVLQGRTVLLVDDDMRNVFALSKVLAGKGLNVLRAENGQVALDLLDKDPLVDLVLMDVMMPEMDGYTCMRAIRERPLFAQLPIIALTAKAMKEDRKKCIDAGANDYITKPVDVERLFSLMRIWITRKKEPL